MNKDLIELYGLVKVGVHNTVKKQCLCGCEMDISEKQCPTCNTLLPKSKLLNVNKNTSMAKRYETQEDDKTIHFIYYNLLSKGFELYEVEAMRLSIDKDTCDVRISDSKVFKAMKGNKYLKDFVEHSFPGLLTYITACLSDLEYEYAVSQFTSLSESNIKNFLTVFIKYKALIPYLAGYKVYYYGTKLDLMSYYPETDFNDIKAVNKTGLNLDLLRAWDIKNVKYVEAIIDISDKVDKKKQELLVTILNNMFSEAGHDRRRIDYNDVMDTFSLLYNKEISVEDFIRIYQNSRENYFCKISEFRKMYKKVNRDKIDWGLIDKIDRKIYGTMATKYYLKSELKLKNDAIDSIYEELEKNPMNALNLLT